MSAKTIAKLSDERSEWRKEHPFGFHAKPERKPDGSWNYLVWECAIPGKRGTIWGRGIYKLTLYFPGDYPYSPPVCKFEKPVYHPNVATTGYAIIPILDKYKDWRPTLRVKSILLELQDMLTKVVGNDYIVDHDTLALMKADLYLYEAKVILNANERFANANISLN